MGASLTRVRHSPVNYVIDNFDNYYSKDIMTELESRESESNCI